MMKQLLAAGLVLSSVASARAATEIEFWHAMGGRLGEVVNEIATNFNAAQDEVQLTPVYKGTYEETLTAGIAAFRAGERCSTPVRPPSSQPRVRDDPGRRPDHRPKAYAFNRDDFI